MTLTRVNILRIDSSTARETSVSRLLADHAISTLQRNVDEISLVRRDMRNGIGNISSAWRDASLASAEMRTQGDRSVLSQSEALVSEVKNTDLLVIAVPIYNFTIPAILKTWIDMVCRENVDGAQALDWRVLPKTKPALVILTSNHTRANAEEDFATPYLTFMLNFIGFNDIRIIDATGLANNRDKVIADAEDSIFKNCAKLMNA